MSDDVQDLMLKLICYNPDERITAEKALQHKWFNTHIKVEKEDVEVANEKLTNFENFKVINNPTK